MGSKCYILYQNRGWEIAKEEGGKISNRSNIEPPKINEWLGGG
jgi:hypothetical protein